MPGASPLQTGLLRAALFINVALGVRWGVEDGLFIGGLFAVLCVPPVALLVAGPRERAFRGVAAATGLLLLAVGAYTLLVGGAILWPSAALLLAAALVPRPLTVRRGASRLRAGLAMVIVAGLLTVCLVFVGGMLAA